MHIYAVVLWSFSLLRQRNPTLLPLSREELSMSQLYDFYKAAGNEAFSRQLTKTVPYFSTIEPMFVDLRPGYAEVTMPNTPKVHNHLGTVHAIAMCNLAEIAAGLMTDVSIPESCRWIPIGMTVKYLAKATTDLRAVADGDGIDWLPGDIEVPVRITDTTGLEVCAALITVKVSVKKQ
jgi:acyl-coenzyme A thioesterase PaaI-like protein